MLNREHVLAVGNFDKKLRYLEDYDLGQRLHKNEYNIIGDPNLITYSIKEESIISVLERYWRWNVQLNSNLSFRSYLKMVHFSLTVMAYSDFKRKDFSFNIFFLSPHYFLHKCIYEFFTNKSHNDKRRPQIHKSSGEEPNSTSSCLEVGSAEDWCSLCSQI